MGIWVAPESQIHVLSLDYHEHLFRLFHQRRLNRLSHYIGIPMALATMYAALPVPLAVAFAAAIVILHVAIAARQTPRSGSHRPPNWVAFPANISSTAAKSNPALPQRIWKRSAGFAKSARKWSVFSRKRTDIIKLLAFGADTLRDHVLKLIYP